MKVDGKTIQIDSLEEVGLKYPAVRLDGVNEIQCNTYVNSITLSASIISDIDYALYVISDILKGYLEKDDNNTSSYKKQLNITSESYILGNCSITTYVGNNSTAHSILNVKFNGIKDYSVKRSEVMTRVIQILVSGLRAYDIKFMISSIHIATDILIPATSSLIYGVVKRKNGIRYIEDMDESELSLLPNLIQGRYLEMHKPSSTSSINKKEQVSTATMYDKIISKDGYKVMRFEIRIEKGIMRTLNKSVLNGHVQPTISMYIGNILSKAQRVIDNYFILYASSNYHSNKIKELYANYNKAKDIGEGNVRNTTAIKKYKSLLSKYRVLPAVYGFKPLASTSEDTDNRSIPIASYGHVDVYLHTMYSLGYGFVNISDMVWYNNNNTII